MSSQELMTDLAVLQQVPGMIDQVRSMVSALPAAAATPAAASATGHPVMSAAVVGIGAELAIFAGMCAKALLDDIETVTGNRQRYEANEQELATNAQSGISALCHLLPGDNRLGGPEVGDSTRAVLELVGRGGGELGRRADRLLSVDNANHRSAAEELPR